MFWFSFPDLPSSFSFCWWSSAHCASNGRLIRLLLVLIVRLFVRVLDRSASELPLLAFLFVQLFMSFSFLFRSSHEMLTAVVLMLSLFYHVRPNCVYIFDWAYMSKHFIHTLGPLTVFNEMLRNDHIFRLANYCFHFQSIVVFHTHSLEQQPSLFV